MECRLCGHSKTHKTWQNKCLMVISCAKKQKQCLRDELAVGDCCIAISLANSSGLILVARVGKHPDELIVISRERKNGLPEMEH